MKYPIRITLLISLTNFVFADIFYIGGKQLNIPTPQGYYRVTPKMDTLYRLSLTMVSPSNEQLAFYIPESKVPSVMSGNIPSMDHYYTLKIHKDLKEKIIGAKQFTEFKTYIKQQNETLFKTIVSKMPKYMKKASKAIAKEFDVDIALKLSSVIPLNVHYETDYSLSYSMYMSYGVNMNKKKNDDTVSTTATLVNVKGKLLFLYCTGALKDLEWTRSASKKWMDIIIKSN